MINHTKKLCVVVGLLSMPLIAKNVVDDFFEAEKKVMGKAHTGMKNMMEDMNTGFQKARHEVKEAIHSALESETTITFSENKESIEITIKGVKATQVQAMINDENNTLTITADATTITIHAQDALLTIATHHQKASDKAAAGEKEGQSYSFATMQESITIANPVLLEKQTINYDQTKEELTILLPKAPTKKTGKPVAVNIIAKATEESVKSPEPAVK